MQDRENTMKRPLVLSLSHSSLCFAMILVCALLVRGLAWADTIPVAMVVQVRESAVREQASVVAPVVRMLKFQDPVLFWGSKDGWAKVQLPGSSKLYYMFESALVPRVPKGVQGEVSDAASGVTSPEIVLAGKGFNAALDAALDSALEDEYTKNTHLDYTWVNQMELWGCSPSALADFILGTP